MGVKGTYMRLDVATKHILTVYIGYIKVLDVTTSGDITLYQHDECIDAIDAWRSGGYKCNSDRVKFGDTLYKVRGGVLYDSLFGRPILGCNIFNFSTMLACDCYNRGIIKTFTDTDTPIVNIEGL